MVNLKQKNEADTTMQSDRNSPFADFIKKIEENDPGITRIDLNELLKTYQNLTKEDLENLISKLSNNETVTELLIEDEWFDLDIILKLIKNNKSIVSLALTCMDLHPDQINKIIVAINHHPTLRKLDLSYNYLESFCDVKDVLVNTSLEEINIKNCIEEQHDEASLAALGEILRRSTLKKLNISDCDLESEAFPFIFDNLAQNKSLIALNVSENEFPNANLVSLENALKENTTLNELDMSTCSFNSNIFFHLYESLKNNNSLISLKLNCLYDYVVNFIKWVIRQPDLNVQAVLRLIELTYPEYESMSKTETLSKEDYVQVIRRVMVQYYYECYSRSKKLNVNSLSQEEMIMRLRDTKQESQNIQSLIKDAAYLWKAQKRDCAPVYLFGTSHVFSWDKEDFFGDLVNQMISKVNIVFTEIIFMNRYSDFCVMEGKKRNVFDINAREVELDKFIAFKAYDQEKPLQGLENQVVREYLRIFHKEQPLGSYREASQQQKIYWTENYLNNISENVSISDNLNNSLTGRNLFWMFDILRYSVEEKMILLVACGSNHNVGKYGLPNLLANAGYDVQPVIKYVPTPKGSLLKEWALGSRYNLYLKSAFIKQFNNKWQNLENYKNDKKIINSFESSEIDYDKEKQAMVRKIQFPIPENIRTKGLIEHSQFRRAPAIKRKADEATILSDQTNITKISRR